MPEHPSVTVTLTRADYNLLAGIVSNADPRVSAWARRQWLARLVLLSGLIVVAALEPLAWMGVALALGVFAIDLTARRSLQQPVQSTLDGVYDVTPEGVRRDSRTVATLVRWQAVKRVVITGGGIVVVFDQGGWVLPLRCFDHESDGERFVASLREHTG